jgi:hypothetical protein
MVNFLVALAGVYTFLLKDLICAWQGDSIYNGMRLLANQP